MSAERDFEEELELLLDEWDKLRIDTRRLRERLDDVGAVETAKEYVRRDTPGLGEAYRRLSSRKTLEGLVLRYAELFDEEASPSLRKSWTLSLRTSRTTRAGALGTGRGCC